MKLIIYLIYLYLTVYTVYYATLAITALKFRRKKRDDFDKKYNNLCVVVYSHNNKETVENLIKQLKNQTYPHNHYTIQLILDNCSDESEVMFQGDLGINVMNVKNVDTIGADQAFSIITEKYSSIKDLDAYVFLDAKYYVNSDFLDKINDSLQENDAVSGAVTLICNGKLSLVENIKYSYNLYKNNFISKTRDILGMSNLVNSDILAIRKKVVDETGSINFSGADEELKYTLALSNIDVRVCFNSDLKIYLPAEDYNLKIPSLSKRINLFFDNILKIKNRNFTHNELICSLIYPNCLVLLLGYYFVFQYAFNVKSLLNYYVVSFGIIVYIISFCISLLHSKIYSKEHLYLFLYPFYALCRIIYNFPPIRFLRNCLFKSGEITHIDKLTVPVFVFDGTRYFSCKLEIVSEAKFTRIFLISKKKKFKTKNHIRAIDAIKEISQKLDSFGYTLRLCQNCKYFESNIDGTVNQINGFCNCPFSNRTPGDILPTVIWNACDAFDKVNVVSLIHSIATKTEKEKENQ